ncbi:hypothetical protein CPLU01_06479 [Colletotrichum plurivorum]|uniref:Aminoglycoside phosphotransferase domain-containing protein n=1 Tax=Colletotrichum plurivorum TaxID=2175906 RepID=A0A8H6NFS9_9PEZI|nr:hypothetical protein CPLU01_06479 [Colletotrichum plurivorum]
MTESSTSWKTAQDFLRSSDDETIACFNRVNWDQPCRIASAANHDLSCVALDQVTSGLYHIVRQLQFSDETRWIARVPVIRSRPAPFYVQKLKDEIATLQFIQENSSLKVPRVLAYNVDVNNPAGAAFMLIEMIPGIVAMDAHGGHKVHRGVIPKEYRKTLHRSVAKCHVQMASLRLPKIGTVVRKEDGGYEAGPIPGIGGPFDTAAAFFEAWAATAKFKRGKEEIAQMLQRAGPISAEEMVKIIEEFPSQIRDMAAHLPIPNEGPFPLCHDDFLHSNIMVDEASFEVTGVIDWEGAWTAPWGLVGYPGFLECMPPSFDLPQHYDEDGQPLEEDVKETWRERREYLEMVREAEGDGDALLSTALGSSLNQALAYTFGAFFSIGKLGFHDRVAAELKEGTQV